MTECGTEPTISDTSFPFLKNKVEGMDLIWNSAAESGLWSVSIEQNLECCEYAALKSSRFFCILLHGPHHELQTKKKKAVSSMWL